MNGNACDGTAGNAAVVVDRVDDDALHGAESVRNGYRNPNNNTSSSSNRLKHFACKSRTILRRTLSRATGIRTKDKRSLNHSQEHSGRDAHRHSDASPHKDEVSDQPLVLYHPPRAAMQHLETGGDRSERGAGEEEAEPEEEEGGGEEEREGEAEEGHQRPIDSLEGNDAPMSHDGLGTDELQQQQTAEQQQQEQQQQQQEQQQQEQQQPDEERQHQHEQHHQHLNRGHQHPALAAWLNVNPLEWFGRDPPHSVAGEEPASSPHTTHEPMSHARENNEKEGQASPVIQVAGSQAARESPRVPTVPATAQGEAGCQCPANAIDSHSDKGHRSRAYTTSTSTSTSTTANTQLSDPHPRQAKPKKRFMVWRLRRPHHQLTAEDARRRTHPPRLEAAPAPASVSNPSPSRLAASSPQAQPGTSSPLPALRRDSDARRTSRPGFPSPLSTPSSHHVPGTGRSPVSPGASTDSAGRRSPPSSSRARGGDSCSQTTPVAHQNHQQQPRSEGSAAKAHASKHGLSTFLSQSVTDLSATSVWSLVPDSWSLCSFSETEDDTSSNMGSGDRDDLGGTDQSDGERAPAVPAQSAEHGSGACVHTGPSSTASHPHGANSNTRQRPRSKKRKGRKNKRSHKAEGRTSVTSLPESATRDMHSRRHRISLKSSNAKSAPQTTAPSASGAAAAPSASAAAGVSSLSTASRAKRHRWICAVRAAVLTVVIALLSLLLFNAFVGFSSGDAVSRAALVRLGMLEGEARVFASVGEMSNMHSRLSEAATLLRLDVTRKPNSSAPPDPQAESPLRTRPQPWLTLKGLSIANELLQADPSLSRLHSYFQDTT